MEWNNKSSLHQEQQQQQQLKLNFISHELVWWLSCYIDCVLAGTHTMSGRIVVVVIAAE